MIATALLMVGLLVAAYTDCRWQTIYNWTTYPGIAGGLVFNGLATWMEVGRAAGQQQRLWGLVGWPGSLWGLLACGGLMILCYVFFPIGGGDVKLVAMMGAWLGLDEGLEALLWTLIIGGCVALNFLVWQIGAGRIFSSLAEYVTMAVRHRGLPTLSDQQRRPLKTPLFLAPGAVAALVIVRFDLLNWFAA